MSAGLGSGGGQGAFEIPSAAAPLAFAPSSSSRGSTGCPLFSLRTGCAPVASASAFQRFLLPPSRPDSAYVHANPSDHWQDPSYQGQRPRTRIMPVSRISMSNATPVPRAGFCWERADTGHPGSQGITILHLHLRVVCVRPVAEEPPIFRTPCPTGVRWQSSGEARPYRENSRPGCRRRDRCD